MNFCGCAAAILGLTLGLAGGASARSAELAFVLNSADASVSVLDVKTQTELRRIPVSREPHHLALTPDQQFLSVGDTTGNEPLVLDPATDELRRGMTMSGP